LEGGKYTYSLCGADMPFFRVLSFKGSESTSTLTQAALRRRSTSSAKERERPGKKSLGLAKKPYCRGEAHPEGPRDEKTTVSPLDG